MTSHSAENLRSQAAIELTRGLDAFKEFASDSELLAIIIEPDHILITTKDNGSGRTLRTYDLAYLLPSNALFTEVINLIQVTVKANWEVDGGESTIHPFGSMLVVSCPEEVHLAIVGLLFELSKMNKENLK